MREFLAEGDVVCAEVQQIFQDGALGVHTRSLKYGKLDQGTLVVVSPKLVKRCKNHFHDLPCGVFTVLGAEHALGGVRSPRSHRLCAHIRLTVGAHECRHQRLHLGGLAVV
jgi:hypothetical protein